MQNSKLLAEVALAFVAKEPFILQMDKALAAMGRFVEVSRVYVFLDDEAARTTSNAYEWCAPGVDPQIEELQGVPYDSIPSWLLLLARDGRIAASDAASLPPDIRAVLEPQGIKSIVVYPVFVEGARAGFIGFDECARERTWEETELYLLKAASGVISAALERKLAADRLAASEEKYRLLYETAPVLMVTIRMESGRVVEANKAFLERLGYEREEVLGRSIDQLGLFVDPVQRRFVGAEISRIGGIQDAELEVRRKDGERLSGLFSARVTEGGGERLLLAVLVDISEQVSLCRRLETQRRRLRNIIDGTRLGTWEWNVKTGETVFNERWAEILGYSLQELQPVSIATWERLAHPEDLAESGRLLEEHFSGRADYYHYESRMRHKDGHWVWVLDRGKVIEWAPDGTPLWMFGTHTDITERKRMEEEIRELATRDALTGLANRRCVLERLEALTAEARRCRRGFSLAMIDLDHFKAINDRHGHQAGDEVLRAFSSLIRDSVRPYDDIGRYGGEEFLILYPGSEAPEAARALSRLLEGTRALLVERAGAEIRFTASCGLASSAEIAAEELSADGLIALADARLYEAKQAGRDRLVGPAGI